MIILVSPPPPAPTDLDLQFNLVRMSDSQTKSLYKALVDSRDV